MKSALELRDLARTPLTVAEENARKLKAVPAAEKVFYDVEPLNQWVLIRKIPRENILGEGGVVGALDVDRSSVGIIIAKADTCKQLNLAINDRVIYTNYAITIEDLEEATGDKELFLVREEEIFCRLTPKKPE